jgi:fucose 4-O-acetylase-like acetyltransferase
MVNKSSYIDSTKGMLIFLVVFCHFAADSLQYSTVLNSVYVLIYTFHIPLFVFFSGFLSKNSVKQRDTAVAKFLGLYLFCTVGFTFFSDLLYSVAMLAQDFNSGLLWDRVVLTAKETLFSVFTATGPAWYLLSLIFWRLLTPYIRKKRFIFISLFLAVVIGGVPQAGPVMSLSRTVVFFPFYLLGYHFDGELFGRLTLKVGAVIKVTAALIILGILLLIQQNVIHLNYNMLYAFSSYQDCGYTFVRGALLRGFIFLLAAVISACFLCLIPKKETILTKWGSGSLNIYILHMFLIPAVGILCSMLNIRLWFVPLVFLAAAASCIVFSGVLSGKITDGIRRILNRLLFGIKPLIHK